MAMGLCLLAAQPVSADTIVLKNGRRILALSVTEEGGKVRYQTAAGELSLPKSIVDHIERGGATPSSAANLAMAPPSAESSLANAAAESAAVHDGAVDREFLAKAVAEARSGNPEANAAAAMAHHAVALFEMSRGDLEHALADEHTALTYAPEDPALLLSVAFLHLRRSEFKQALDYLERAKRVAPDNPDVPKLEGWAYYGLNKLNEAVREWQRALALRPDSEVQAALQKAQRDQQEEENYRENESAHFSLKYSGEAEPQLAREVLRALETHFSADRVRAELHAAGAYRRDFVHAAGFCGHYASAALGRCDQRRAHSRAGARVDAIDAGLVARAETRIDAQLRAPENARARAHLGAGGAGAVDGRETQRSSGRGACAKF